MAAPLKNGNFENMFFHVTRGPKRDIEPNLYEHTASNVKDYTEKTENGPNKQTNRQPTYIILDGLSAPMAAEWQPSLKMDFLNIFFFMLPGVQKRH